MAVGLRGLPQLGPDCGKGFTQLLANLPAILLDLRPHSLKALAYLWTYSLFKQQVYVFMAVGSVRQSMCQSLQHDAN